MLLKKPIAAVTPDATATVPSAPKKVTKTTKTAVAVKEPEPARLEEISPYPFVMSEEKGRKAAVRFRENLRKHYPDLNLSDGLTIKDQPILHLFCYDHDTEIAYCRLFSSKHNGPIFPSVTELYNCYNLSQQGHPQDVFVYAGTDEDRGVELGAFLKANEIRSINDFTPAQRKLLEESVEANPIRRMNKEALEEKKRRKAAETSSKKRQHDDVEESAAVPPSATAAAATSSTGGAAEETSGGTDTKKKPGRPKGSNQVSATKRSRSRSSSSKSSSSVVPICLIPTSLTDLSISAAAGLDATTATVSYKREQLRLGDLPMGSIERAALNWSVFSHIISTPGNAFGVDPPTDDAEQFLRNALTTAASVNGGAVDDGAGVVPIDVDEIENDEEMATSLKAALQADPEEEEEEEEVQEEED